MQKNGHYWNGCKCVRCGEIRDEGHQFDIKGQDGHVCKICRKSEPHVWDGCICKACGETRHTFGDDGFCIHCGQGKVIDWLKEVISEDGTLYHLVTFDADRETNEILESEYSSETYDENWKSRKLCG